MHGGGSWLFLPSVQTNVLQAQSLSDFSGFHGNETRNTINKKYAPFIIRFTATHAKSLLNYAGTASSNARQTFSLASISTVTRPPWTNLPNSNSSASALRMVS